MLARYGAGVGEILDIAAQMPGGLRPIADGEPAVVAELVYEARHHPRLRPRHPRYVGDDDPAPPLALLRALSGQLAA